MISPATSSAAAALAGAEEASVSSLALPRAAAALELALAHQQREQPDALRRDGVVDVVDQLQETGLRTAP